MNEEQKQFHWDTGQSAGYLATLYQLQRLFSWLCTVKDKKGSHHELFQSPALAFAWKNWEKPQKPSVRTAGVLEMWMIYHPRTSQTILFVQR